MRTILAIEASNPSASAPGVCVGRVSADGVGAVEVLGAWIAEDSGRSGDGVMDAVDRACRAAGVGPRDLDAVAVSIGPGGFTALRIATTSAKAMAFALGIPVIPVPTALVAARAVDASDRPSVIALASKKDLAHLTLLHPDGAFESLGVLDAHGIPAGVRSLVADAFLPEPFAVRAAAMGLERLTLMLSPRACLEAAAGLDAVPPDALSPLYAREPDAVTQWRVRHGSRP
jgi:tRNA A37 threonylcarbamoyladenosine modification protein TsaB